MKILVSGGAGFIGSHLVDDLINKLHDVVIIDNLSTGKSNYINKKATFYNSDITNFEQIDPIIKKEKSEIVFHLAAQVQLRNSLLDPIHDARTNILGTINLLESLKSINVKKIIYTSTGGARYGEPLELPVDEKHPLNPISPYGISKHTAEHYIEMYSKLHNIDYLIFCFGNVYGPRDDPSNKRVTSLFLEKMLNNISPTIIGDGNQTRDFIYVKDLTEFLVSSIEKNPKHKIFNLSNSQSISVNDIYFLIKKHLNYGGEAVHIPAINGEIKDIVLNTNLAKSELNWKPLHSFEQGLIETIDWFKKNINPQKSN